MLYNRDMILQVRMQTNWQQIIDRRNRIQGKSLLRENNRRRPHRYRVTDQVLIIKNPDDRKHQRKIGDPVTEGPYHITRINHSGAVQIRRRVTLKLFQSAESNHSDLPDNLRPVRFKTRQFDRQAFISIFGYCAHLVLRSKRFILICDELVFLGYFVKRDLKKVQIRRSVLLIGCFFLYVCY